MNVRQKLSLAALSIALPVLASAQAAAPAAAPAAPAAPAAGVKVGGTLNVNFQITQAKGATDPAQSVKARNAVSSDSSNIFVDAFADVAFGLKAIARCETSASVDLSGSTLCNRNSRVGVSSGEYGTLFFGNWDTPFKAATYGTKVDDPFQNTDVFGYQSIMGSPGFGYRSSGWSTASNTTVAGFDIRANNSVAYHSPKFAGANVKVQYSSSEFAAAKGDDANGGSIPQLLSVAAGYDWEGLSIVAAYERHWDAYGLNQIAGNVKTHNTIDQAWRVGAGYEIASGAGTTTVSALVDQVIFQQDKAAVGAVKEFKRLAWQIAAKHRYGDHELRARYNSAAEGDCSFQGGGTCNADDTGASQITVGYAYHLSKSAQAYLSYTRLMNQKFANYALTIGGSPDVTGNGTTTLPPVGADPTALGLGLRFTF